MTIDETIVIRPPSEAGSFLLPVTVGCSHAGCTFCGMFDRFRFRIIDLKDIMSYIDVIAARYRERVRRVFLENGDALIAPQENLVEVLKHLRNSFPNMERVGTYATPKSALIKTVEELQTLQKLGLTIAYLGVESGDREVLKRVNKGASYEEIVEAGQKLKQGGIKVSATVILGLGGPELSERHAVATGKILSEIDPDYAGALTLMLVPESILEKEWKEGRFQLITPFQSLVELKLIVENLEVTDCFFTSNHASNYLPIRAQLPQQKAEVLKLISDVLEKHDLSLLKPEAFRAL